MKLIERIENVFEQYKGIIQKNLKDSSNKRLSELYGNYIEQNRKQKKADESTLTDSMLKDILINVFDYSKEEYLLTQHAHKIKKNKQTVYPDYETNTTFSKKAILFDAKSSHHDDRDMTDGIHRNGITPFQRTFEKYLLHIETGGLMEYNYIVGFNLEKMFLYKKQDNKVKCILKINLIKVLEKEPEEIKKLKELYNKIKFEKLDLNTQIELLSNKKRPDDSVSEFNTERFIKKFNVLKNDLNYFFVKQLQSSETINSIEKGEWSDNKQDQQNFKKSLTNSDHITSRQSDLLAAIKDEKRLVEAFFIKEESRQEDPLKDDGEYKMLVNRLFLMKFFQLLFIKIFEDFGIIEYKNGQPITYSKKTMEIRKRNAKGNSELEDVSFKQAFYKEYVNGVIQDGGKKIEEIYSSFSGLFQKYDTIIDRIILRDKEAQTKFNELLFEILVEFNSFNFKSLRQGGEDLIGTFYEQSLNKSDRFEFGQFYTSRDVIDYMLDELDIDPSKAPKIADPACGTGGFLVRYLSRVSSSMFVMKDKQDRLKKIFQNTIGADIKQFSVELSRLNLVLLFLIKYQNLKEGGYLNDMEIPEIETNINQGDGLEASRGGGLFNDEGVLGGREGDESFDYIVGNPPYLNMGTMNSTKQYNILKDKDGFYKEFFYYTPNLFYFFIAQGIRKLKMGGKMAFIIPSKLLKDNPAEPLRKYILENTKILKIVNLGDVEMFEGTSTKFSLMLFVEKRNPEDKINNHFFDYMTLINHPKKEKHLVECLNELDPEKIKTKGINKESGGGNFGRKQLKKLLTNNGFGLNELVDKIKNNEKNIKISRLGGLTSKFYEFYLDEFISIDTIKQKSLIGESQWNLRNKITSNKNNIFLGDIYEVSKGVVSGKDNVYYPQKGRGNIKKDKIKGEGLEDLKNNNERIGEIKLYLKNNDRWVELNKKEKKIIKKSYRLRHGRKFIYNKNNFDPLLYIRKKDIKQNKEKYHNIFKYLKGYKNILKKRGENKRNKKKSWYSISWKRQQRYFTKPKIVASTFGTSQFKKYGFLYVGDEWYTYGGENSIILDENTDYYSQIKHYTTPKKFLKFTTSILNSKPIMDFLISNNFKRSNPSFLRDQLIIPKPNFQDPFQNFCYHTTLKKAEEVENIFKTIEKILESLKNLSIVKKGGGALNVNQKVKILLESNPKLDKIADAIVFDDGEIESFIFQDELPEGLAFGDSEHFNKDLLLAIFKSNENYDKKLYNQVFNIIFKDIIKGEDKIVENDKRFLWAAENINESSLVRYFENQINKISKNYYYTKEPNKVSMKIFGLQDVNFLKNKQEWYECVRRELKEF